MLASIMILEKSKNKEEITDNLIQIIKNTTKGSSRDNLKRMVLYLYKNFDEEFKKQILELIEESEGEEDMLNARRILDAEIRKERREGLLEGIRQTIVGMIKVNLDDNIIAQATGKKKTEIQKIRKALQGK